MVRTAEVMGTKATLKRVSRASACSRCFAVACDVAPTSWLLRGERGRSDRKVLVRLSDERERNPTAQRRHDDLLILSQFM